MTSTREILPNIDFFVDCLEASLNELRAAVKPVKKRRVRKKKRAV